MAVSNAPLARYQFTTIKKGPGSRRGPIEDFD
jgi:hypothetical protein